jgi:hypothetical protein
MTKGDADALVLFKAGLQILVTFSLSHSILHRVGGNLTSGHVIRFMLRFWKQEGNLLGHTRGRGVMQALPVPVPKAMAHAAHAIYCSHETYHVPPT